MNLEQSNNQPRYLFTENRDFLIIEKNLGHKFEEEDLAAITTLLAADKNVLISHFHNFFSSYEASSLAELERLIARGFENDEEKEVTMAFYHLLKKYDWHISLNIESFVEEYTG